MSFYFEWLHFSFNDTTVYQSASYHSTLQEIILRYFSAWKHRTLYDIFQLYRLRPCILFYLLITILSKLSVVLVVRESSVFRSQTHRLSRKEDSISNDNNYLSQKSDERILSPSHPRNVVDSPECSPHREAVNDVSKSWIVFDKYKKEGSLMNHGDPKNNLAKTFPSNYDISLTASRWGEHSGESITFLGWDGDKILLSDFWLE